jgi:hypothetical protein
VSYRVQGSYTTTVMETYETQREATERAEHLARAEEGAIFAVTGHGLSVTLQYIKPDGPE